MSINNHNPLRVNQARDLIIEQVALSVAISRYGIEIYKDRIVCPFHNDDNPSCFVSDERKTYHCFGCKAKGTVVEFVRDYERMYGDNKQFSQIDAINKLAERYTIDIPDLEDKTLPEPEKRVRKKRELDVDRIIVKRLEQYEQRAKGIQDLDKRLAIYNTLDNYYYGNLDGEEAILQIKGDMKRDG